MPFLDILINILKSMSSFMHLQTVQSHIHQPYMNNNKTFFWMNLDETKAAT